MADENKAAEKSLAEQIDETRLQEARMRLTLTQREVAQFEATEADKKRRNTERQKQLSADRQTRANDAKMCNHRQGGTPKNPFKGKGSTALRVAKFPDGFTKVIMCPICRLRAFSPHPNDQGTEPRLVNGKMESEAQAAKRVKKYQADKAAWDKLYEQSRDGLTEEEVQEMDCGTTITLTDTRTGAQVLPRRPCDSYAML